MVLNSAYIEWERGKHRCDYNAFFAVAISRGVAARSPLTKPDERTKSKIRCSTRVV